MCFSFKVKKRFINYRVVLFYICVILGQTITFYRFLSPPNVCTRASTFIENGSVVMLVIKRLAGVAPE